MREGYIFKHPSGYYCINVRNAHKIVFDGYGLGIYDKTGTHCNRIAILGSGRYVCDEYLTHKYEIATIEALARAFSSNDDLRVWLETVFRPYEVDGKRYVLRVAKGNIQACTTCARSDKNGFCLDVNSSLSCTREACNHDAKSLWTYFQRID